jgi:hypothetical protein
MMNPPVSSGKEVKRSHGNPRTHGVTFSRKQNKARSMVVEKIPEA